MQSMTPEDQKRTVRLLQGARRREFRFTFIYKPGNPSRTENALACDTYFKRQQGNVEIHRNILLIIVLCEKLQ